MIVRLRHLGPAMVAGALIAAIALRHDAVVVHRDRDFDVLAEIGPLRAERWD